MALRAGFRGSAVLLGRERTELTCVDVCASKVLLDDVERLGEVLLSDLGHMEGMVRGKRGAAGG